MTAGGPSLAVIQARTGSSRLPGKVLADLEGQPMLARVVQRVQQAERLDKVMVATSTLAADDPIVGLCCSIGVDCFRGSEDDVLDRFYRAASTVRPLTVVRVTADCPLIDPAVIDDGLRFVSEWPDVFDYLGLPAGYPEGIDAEFFTFAALAEAWAEAKLPSEREHVTPFLWKNNQRYKIGRIPSRLPEEANHSALHWSVDESQDLEFVREIWRRLGSSAATFRMEDVLRLLEQEPALLEINTGGTGYEGYDRSVKEDKEDREWNDG